MIGSTAFYAGVVIALAGLLGVVHPIALLGLTSRTRGATLLVGGVALVVIAVALPARQKRVGATRTRLDEFAPVYEFHEVHSARVAAQPDRVYRALRAVTAGEIPLFQLLTRMRRFGRSGPESILNAPDRAPVLDVATRTGFIVLADDAPREFVVGTVVIAPPGWQRSDAATPEAFKALHDMGFAIAAMNFHIVPDGTGGTTISTETRVHATDASSRRRFATYWRVIYPGSALIRRSWLRAIRRRAERAFP